MGTPPSQTTLKVVHWNIYHSQGVEFPEEDDKYSGGRHYEELAWKHRSAAALAQLKEMIVGADVVCLQEIRSYNLNEVVKVLQEEMGEHTMLLTHSYGKRLSPVDGSSDKLLTAVRCNILTSDVKYAKMMSHECYQTFSWVLDNGRRVHVYNVHFPMREEARMEVAAQLALVREIPRDHCVIVMGDMNAFPDAHGYQQMQSLMSGGNLYDGTQFLKNRSDGRRARVTFRPYPCDNAPKLDDPDKLDYILLRNLMPVEDPVCWDNMQQCVTDQDTGITYGASDHYAITVRLKLV